MFTLKKEAEAAMRGIYRKDTSHSKNSTRYPFVLGVTTAILFSFVSASTSLAATPFQGSLQSVSIADAIGTNMPPVAEFTYTADGNTVSFDGGSSVDSDGTITEYKWDFGDGTTATGATASHNYADLADIRVSLTVKDNTGAVSITQQPITPPQTAVSFAVNFQPSDAAIPSGFSIDTGSAYSDQRGYGWVSLPNSLGGRDRDSSLSPDQSYDTLFHASPTAVWEYKLDNGTYNVTVVVGDPKYPDETSAVQAEKIVVIPPTVLSTDIRWIEKQATVNVTDQKLTLTFTGSTIAKICWVKISN